MACFLGVCLTPFLSCACPVLTTGRWLLHVGLGFPGGHFLPAFQAGQKCLLLSCLPTSFWGVSITPFLLGMCAQVPFYKIHIINSFSIFLLPQLPPAPSRKCSYLLGFRKTTSAIRSGAASYKHYVLSTFPSGAQETISPPI